MSAANEAPLFATYPIGSLPRPQWVRDLIVDRNAGRVSLEAADHLLDDAVPLAIRLQEQAGMDYVSDGEWRRTHYARVFTEAVDGFQPDLVPNAGQKISERHAAPAKTSDPGVVAHLQRRRTIAADEARFLRSHAASKTIVALPSPHTLARRMWSKRHSTSAYATPEEFMDAIIPIIRAEIETLVELGVDAIQLDNPWPPVIIDPDLAQSEHPSPAAWASNERGMAEDLDEEAALVVKCINGATKGIPEERLGLHICHTRGHTTRASYDAIIGVLGQMNIHRFALEFATPSSDVTDALQGFPDNKFLGLGVIHPFSAHIETAEEVAAIAERALEYVPKERITLNPNCGFGPGAGTGKKPKTGNVPVDMDEAYLKLRAMSQGAALLRERHG
jgi:5-methyltetrahydropteroyltriglutamate--homocysteine methyltransferase